MRNIATTRIVILFLSLLIVFFTCYFIGIHWKNKLLLTTNEFSNAHHFKPKLAHRNEMSFLYSIDPLNNYPICDPFTDKNRCMPDIQLQTILKTAHQQNQYIYVLQKLDQLQLPRKLALIPIIESQYNPYKLSSKGAAGVWQLMPETAKELGLLEYQRFELVASTQAALQLLRQLHQQFGNWELAIAAYNAGSKRVQTALLLNPNAKKVEQLSLPSATKKYISDFNQMHRLLLRKS
jgi:membrane-bound lytic murein transglycosylase D